MLHIVGIARLVPPGPATFLVPRGCATCDDPGERASRGMQLAPRSSPHARAAAPTAFGTTAAEPAGDSGGPDRATLPEPGYALGGVLGRGGMGEVLAARDRRIGREVAIKRMRAAAPTGAAISRFLREARIQARLDHPAIVPVHDLGLDEAGRPYFAMKRLAGETLAHRLAAGAPLQDLLRAFVDVCMAIEFAHARGVVHRDLKPANIMLGDYGEVYVLDWGIARALGEPASAGLVELTGDRVAGGTQAGDLLGTPGYMAPEQARGEEAGYPADVYALGATLFEVLAGELLHPRGEGALTSTLARPQQRPAHRSSDRDIAPELDAACHAALAADPAARPTARELRQAIQRYLDGDRDLARRRALAQEHLAVARAAIETGDPERRAQAMQRAGHALALDPASVEALQLVTTMIVEPPPSLPGELVAQIRAEECRLGRARMRIGVFPLLAPFMMAVLLPWLHVRSWTNLALCYASLCAAALVQRFARFRGPTAVAVSFAMVLVLSLAFSRVAGPFVLTPIVVTGMFMAISASRWLDARRWILLAWIAIASLAPIACESVGLLAPSWEQTPQGLRTLSSIFEARSWIEPFSLVATNLLLVSAIAIYAAGVHRDARAARRRLTMQAWHLRQLLPAGHVPTDAPDRG